MRPPTRLLSAGVVAASAALLAPAARATMTLNLRLASGATTMLLGGDQDNTDIPVQVWATVTGSSTISPVPVAGDYASNPSPTTNGVFDGLQYVYYNVTNSNAAGNYITGGIDATSGEGPTLNPTLKFNGNGSQPGDVPNTPGGISVGSSSSITLVAKPRSAAAVFDNDTALNQSSGKYHVYGNDGANITTSGTSASFLLETVSFKPTAFSSLSKTTFSLALPTDALVASGAGHDAVANWFEDAANQSTRAKADGSSATVNTAWTVGTTVTFQDTLAGDANLDGSVNGLDLSALAANFGKTGGATFAQGDFNGDGAVNGLDLSALAANFSQSIGTITPSLAAASTYPEALAIVNTADPGFVSSVDAGLSVSAVPEPGTAAALGLGVAASLARRRRARQVAPSPATARASSMGFPVESIRQRHTEGGR